jgi:hypothetical protein
LTDKRLLQTAGPLQRDQSDGWTRHCGVLTSVLRSVMLSRCVRVLGFQSASNDNHSDGRSDSTCQKDTENAARFAEGCLWDSFDDIGRKERSDNCRDRP